MNNNVIVYIDAKYIFNFWKILFSLYTFCSLISINYIILINRIVLQNFRTNCKISERTLISTGHSIPISLGVI